MTSSADPDLAGAPAESTGGNGHAAHEPELAPRAPPELPPAEMSAAACALLFASPEPLTLPRLCQLLGDVAPARAREALADLGRRLGEAGLPIEVVSVAGGWRLMTSPGRADLVARLARARKTERITPAALETLSIVAYRQPVTKAEIEAIRGVQSGPILRSLVDRGLARISGRADQPGAPLQYGTTRSFLDHFGLGALEDLPRDAELVRD